MTTIKNIDPKMIVSNIEPFRPIHPGEILKEEIESRGISQRKLAAEIGIQYSQLNEILNAKRQLTAECALLLEVALNIPTSPLLRMQADFNLMIAKRNPSIIEKLKRVHRIAAAL